MQRAYYSASITDFLAASPNTILGVLVKNSGGSATEHTQRDAWLQQINILKRALTNRSGRIYFDYAIPRMGKRIDVVLIIGPVIFVLEFKVGESHFTTAPLDQVTDYCLDLKNFHESSYVTRLRNIGAGPATARNVSSSAHKFLPLKNRHT